MGGDAEVKWISHLLDLSDDWLKQALTQKVTVSVSLSTVVTSSRVLTPVQTTNFRLFQTERFCRRLSHI